MSESGSNLVTGTLTSTSTSCGYTNVTFSGSVTGSELSLTASTTCNGIPMNLEYTQGILSGNTINGSWINYLNEQIEMITEPSLSPERRAIVWRNTSTGENKVWYMNGTTMTSSADLYAVADQTWTIVGTGDFNNDGNTDILWRNTSTGENAVWYMNGVNLTSWAIFYAVADQTWKIVGTGDFNNDGKHRYRLEKHRYRRECGLVHEWGNPDQLGESSYRSGSDLDYRRHG